MPLFVFFPNGCSLHFFLLDTNTRLLKIYNFNFHNGTWNDGIIPLSPSFSKRRSQFGK